MPGLSAPERQKTGVLRRLVVWQGRAAGRLCRCPRALFDTILRSQFELA
jgi:hypothetical protein